MWGATQDWGGREGHSQDPEPGQLLAHSRRERPDARAGQGPAGGTDSALEPARAPAAQGARSWRGRGGLGGEGGEGDGAGLAQAQGVPAETEPRSSSGSCSARRENFPDASNPQGDSRSREGSLTGRGTHELCDLGLDGGPSLVPSTPLLPQAWPRSDALCPRCMGGWQRMGEPCGPPALRVLSAHVWVRNPAVTPENPQNSFLTPGCQPPGPARGCGDEHGPRGRGPQQTRQARTAPRGRVGGRRGQHTTHSVSRLEVPLRSGNSWMSVAPFRDLEAELAARRQGQRVHVRLPALGVSLHVTLPPARLDRPGSRDLGAAGLGSPGSRQPWRSGPECQRHRRGASRRHCRKATARRLRGARAARAEPPPAGLGFVGRPPCSSLLGCLRLVASRPPHPPVSTRTHTRTPRTPRTRTRQGHRKRAADPSGRRGVQTRAPMQGQGPGSEPGQDLGAQDPSIKCTQSPRG